jgi:hypothetical protein
MSNTERRKLDRFLINIELLGDLQRAAFKIPIRTKLLRKWLNTPEINWVIKKAEINAERGARGEDEIYVPLWWSRETLANLRLRAKIASQNLKAAGAEILHAAENNDTQFFIALGKCLSGEIDVTVIDQREAYVAGLLTRYPSITTKDAIDQLTRVGFHRISEGNFRMLKKRLKGKVHTVEDRNASRYALHGLAQRLNISAT